MPLPCVALVAASDVLGVPLSPATIEALEESAITIGDPGREAVSLAERWRRPLLSATESAILVCPQTGPTGDALYPHPLWDEISGLLGEENASRLETETPRFPAEPARDWTKFVARLRRVEALMKRVKKLESK